MVTFEETLMRVLVVDDNPQIANALQSGLEEHSFAVDVANTGFEGEEKAASGVYDVVLLDLMLPDRDGVEVCRNLRRRGVDSKILMLTALNSTHDKVHGLDSGADDYLSKPFEFDELLARIRALLRRGEAAESRHLRFEDLELDLYTRVARRGDQQVQLSNREFALLECLMRNPHRVLSRAQIGSKLWDLHFDSTSNLVDVYVSSVRKKIDRGFGSPLIQTVKGVGYRLGAPVVVES